MSILEFLPKAALDAQHMSALLTLASNEIIALRAELTRCVFLLDGACVLPDGSNADTRKAHALLGDFEKQED